MAVLDNDILYDFNKLTGFDLTNYLNKCNSFIINDYPLLYNYFNAVTINIDSIILTRYDDIVKDSKILKIIIRTHSNIFENVQYWDLFDFIDDLNTKINTISKLSKYLRSTKTNYGFTNTVSFESTLKYQQTIDELISENIGDQSELFSNNTAIKNDLLESDYEIGGGKNITLNKSVQDILSEVTTIVDNPNNLTILGLDLPVLLEFDDVENDFRVLGYEDTLKQTCEILTNLQQNDLPLQRNRGINKKLSVGSNVGVLVLRDLIDQLKSNFGMDDLFDGIIINNISLEEDKLYIDFNINIKLNSAIAKSLTIGES